jgi:hypothetical protein
MKASDLGAAQTETGNHISMADLGSRSASPGRSQPSGAVNVD